LNLNFTKTPNALITRNQEKWFRKLEEAKITILEQVYTLKVNENKRRLVYNTNNKLIKTKPYELKDGNLPK
jgi:hypothetical protein